MQSLDPLLNSHGMMGWNPHMPHPRAHVGSCSLFSIESPFSLTGEHFLVKLCSDLVTAVDLLGADMGVDPEVGGVGVTCPAGETLLAPSWK